MYILDTHTLYICMHMRKYTCVSKAKTVERGKRKALGLSLILKVSIATVEAHVYYYMYIHVHVHV